MTCFPANAADSDSSAALRVGGLVESSANLESVGLHTCAIASTAYCGDSFKLLTAPPLSTAVPSSAKNVGASMPLSLVSHSWSAAQLGTTAWAKRAAQAINERRRLDSAPLGTGRVEVRAMGVVPCEARRRAARNETWAERQQKAKEGALQLWHVP